MENDKKMAIQNALVNVELEPVLWEKGEVYTERFSKLPIGKLSTIGTAFEPLASAIQSVVVGNNGGSGLYMVNTKGSHMFSFKDGSGFLGSLKNIETGGVGGGQATLNPVAFNPTMMFMAMALYSIDRKLDSIQETQKEIIEFLERREKSKLKGDIVYLTDVLDNYKYNWNNDKYKNSNHIKVLDIKQASEQSILFYQEQISEKMKTKSFLHGDKDVKSKLKKLDSDFEGYQLAIYLHAFSSFLEIMLLENFDSEYLGTAAKKIEDNELRYRELYTNCYDQIEKYSKSTVESHLVKGLSVINKTVGTAMANIPVVNKSQIDETLLESSSRLQNYNSRKTDRNLEQLVRHQSSSVRQFEDNIHMVNKLHNEPIELLVDKENIYFSLPE